MSQVVTETMVRAENVHRSYGHGAAAVHALYPDNSQLKRIRDQDRIVVSEPLGDLPGLWHEIPESTVLLVQPGPDEERPFTPRRPARMPATA